MSLPSTTTDAPEDGGGVPRRVVGATVLQVVGRLWGAACTMTILYLLGNRLEDRDFGAFTFYLAVFAWLDSLTMLGTGHVAVQRTAADPSRIPGVLAACRRIRWVAGFIGVALVGGGAFAFGEPGAWWILLASLYPLTHVLELSVTVMRNRIAWGVPVAVRATASGLGLVFVLLLLGRDGMQPAPYLVAIAAGSTLGNFMLYAACRGSLPRVVGPVRPEPGVLRAAIPLGFAGLCGMTYFYVDNLFIRALEGEEALGPYNVAVRFLSVFIMVAQFSTLSAMPWFTRRAEVGALGGAIDRLGPPLFAAAGVGAGLLWPFADELLELFHAGYGEEAASLRWLLLAVVAIHGGAVFQTALVAVGRTGAVLRASALGLVVNLLGNLWAVPRYGIEGAAAATLATELAVASMAFVQIRRAPGDGAPPRFLPWLVGPIGFLLAWSLSTWAMGNG